MYETEGVEKIVSQFFTDKERGLREKEAGQRLLKDGPNALKEKPPKTLIQSFFQQLMDPLIYVLLVAGVIALCMKEWNDAVIIVVVVLLNAIVGMVQEGRARRALEALKHMSTPKAHVIRDGVVREIDAAELVVGDLVVLEAGNRVPADIRLTDSHMLSVAEGELTGESVPIHKDAGGVCKRQMPLGDRVNMVYMSTLITMGRGRGIVVATGMDTEIGHIAHLINESKEELTPLQKKLGELGKLLGILSLLLCLVLFGIALWQKRDLLEMLLTAISLAVAAVPEGLPAVVTICLALSVTRMVKVETIIRKLPAVETLGAVSVVCSDKTGTLTKNCMTVVKCLSGTEWVEEQAVGKEKHPTDYLLASMVLCNDGRIHGGEKLGDPTELAILEYALSCGANFLELHRKYPRSKELPFDSNRKMMTTYHGGGEKISFTKGAPDRILEKCTRIWLNNKEESLTPKLRKKMEFRLQEMAGEGLRTMAFAMVPSATHPVEKNMTFLGMIGMLDPIREEAREAILEFKRAGVETVMITGDHVDTAFHIGKQLEIVSSKEECLSGEQLSKLSEEAFLDALNRVKIFARVEPAGKVRIVNGFKRLGKIVAMTGDGVNDAPSLKAADIGIAMGRSGTDVAKQAADMVLTDDNFATIRKAIEEGRGIYENIRKSVIFLLSSNMGELLTMFVAVLMGLPSPLKSSHILWINLITDSLPALALGVDKNDGASLMRLPPRKTTESIFARGGLLCTCFYGILIAGISLGAFLLAPEGDLMRGQTYAFTVLGMSQLFHAIGMRDTTRSVFRKSEGNKLMVVAVLFGGFLQVLVTEIPIFTSAFGTVSLSGKEWGMLSILAAFPLFAHELISVLSFPGKEG